MNITPVNRTQNTTFGAWTVPVAATESIIKGTPFSTVAEQASSLLAKVPEDDFSLNKQIIDLIEKPIQTDYQTIIDEKEIAEFEKEKDKSVGNGLKKLHEFNNATIVAPTQLERLLNKTSQIRAEIDDKTTRLTNTIHNFFENIE